MVTFVVTRRAGAKQKTANSLRISGLWWCHQESNRGHKDFQSFALPTELWHHRCSLFAGGRRCFPFASAKLELFFELTKFYGKLFMPDRVNELFFLQFVFVAVPDVGQVRSDVTLQLMQCFGSQVVGYSQVRCDSVAVGREGVFHSGIGNQA